MCYTVCMWENEGWPVFKVLEKQDAYDQKSLKKISEQVKFGAKPQVSIINWDRWVYTFVLSSFHCCYFHHQYCCFLLLLVSILIFIHLIFFIFSLSIVSPLQDNSLLLHYQSDSIPLWLHSILFHHQNPLGSFQMQLKEWLHTLYVSTTTCWETVFGSRFWIIKVGGIDPNMFTRDKILWLSTTKFCNFCCHILLCLIFTTPKDINFYKLNW